MFIYCWFITVNKRNIENYVCGMSSSVPTKRSQSCQSRKVYKQKVVRCAGTFSLNPTTYQRPVIHLAILIVSSLGHLKKFLIWCFRNFKPTYCKNSVNTSWINVIFGLRTCVPNGSVFKPQVIFLSVYLFNKLLTMNRNVRWNECVF